MAYLKSVFINVPHIKFNIFINFIYLQTSIYLHRGNYIQIIMCLNLYTSQSSLLCLILYLRLVLYETVAYKVIAFSSTKCHYTYNPP